MIIVMRRAAEQVQVDAVLQRIAADGQPVHVFRGEERVVIAVLGESPREQLLEELSVLAGVEEVGRTTRPYKLASREVRPANSCVQIGRARLGEKFIIGAGAARLHQAAELTELARQAEEAGAHLFWLGRPGGAELGAVLPLLAELRRNTRLPLLVEVWGAEEIDPLRTHCDALMIGPQHLHSFPLIKAASQSSQPLVLCRGLATSIEEWLLVAEQILKAGNFQVVLCEQGIRTFDSTVCSTLDFSAVAVVKRLSHLPVIGSPSLAAGRRELVPALALGAAGAGASGVLIDVHLGPIDEPGAGPQSLTLADFRQLAKRLEALTHAMASLSA